VLYVAGHLPILNQPSIAVVGSRNATSSGLQTSYDFSYTLAKLGLAIVSGLAQGIDCQAHLGAMDAEIAGTVAVMATGHARVYPAQHRGLYRRIVESGGAVISELSHHEKLSAGQFPRRNRIISGLSLGTLVVEASMRSGSLLTARHALDQGREVFAVPGSIHSPVSKGCNHLIKQGACLVEAASDILNELPLDVHVVPADTPDTPHGTHVPQDLPAECMQVLQTLGTSALCIDQLTTKSGLTTGQVSSILVQLEIKGLVYQSGMGHYVSSAVQKLS
jgi:DNA processing protein